MSEPVLPELRNLAAREPAVRGPECPPEEVWAVVAAGLISTTEEEVLLAHAAQCDYCALRLRKAAALAESDQVRGDIWGSGPFRIWAIAAAVVLFAGLTAFILYPKWQFNQSRGEIAAAYRQSRPFAFRVSDVQWGPAQQARGSEKPGLLPVPSGDSAESLTWAARAALWEGDPRHAAELLGRARAMAGDSAALLNDLAVAEAQAGDPNRALRLLEDAAKRFPGNQVLLFNRAVCLVATGRVADARPLFLQVAATEPDEAWRREARQQVR